MEIFAAFIVRRPVQLGEEQALSERLAAHLPFGRSDFTHSIFVTRDRHCLIASWNNGASSSLHRQGDSAAILSGYGRSGREIIGTSAIFSQSRRFNDRNDYFRRLGGVYTYVEYNEEARALRAWNTPARIRPLYYGASKDVAVVSNRAAMASELLNGDCSVSLDGDAATYPFFLLNGYFASDRTPFRGVHALEGDTNLHLRPGHVDKMPISGPWEPTGVADEAVVIERLSSVLVDIAAALDDQASNPILGLSGGKDSRFLLSAIIAADAKIEVTTYGYDEHPDVIVAKQIAQHFGIPQIIRAPADGADLLHVDVGQRVYQSIFMTEGMLHPWMQISPPTGPLKEDEILSGYGGELFRGGFAKYKHQKPSLVRDKEWLSSFFGGKFLREQDMLTPDASERLSAWSREALASDLTRTSPAAFADKFYLDYRAGRWASASFTAREASVAKFYPLCDAELLRVAYEANSDARLNDRLIVGVIRTLAPELLRFPLADNQWAAWSEGGTGFSWDDISPVNPVPLNKTGRANVDWRLAVATDLKSAFRDLLLEAKPAVFDFVDEERLFAGLDDGMALRGACAKTYWNIAGFIALLNGAASSQPEREGRPATVRLDRHWPDIEARSLARQRKVRASRANNATDTDKEGQRWSFRRLLSIAGG